MRRKRKKVWLKLCVSTTSLWSSFGFFPANAISFSFLFLSFSCLTHFIFWSSLSNTLPYTLTLSVFVHLSLYFYICKSLSHPSLTLLLPLYGIPIWLSLILSEDNVCLLSKGRHPLSAFVYFLHLSFRSVGEFRFKFRSDDFTKFKFVSLRVCIPKQNELIS